MKGYKVLSYELQPEIDKLPHPYQRRVTLDCVLQRDGSDKWAIRSGGRVLSKKGEWEYEPMPSKRTDAFIARTRFRSVNEALIIWQKFQLGE